MYPTQEEEKILKVFKQLHYLTVDQVMLATGNTSLLMSQRRLKNLTDNGYLWKVGRQLSENGGKEKYAYTYSDLTRTYLKEQGKIILPSRKPKPYFLGHSLAINDILVRVAALQRGNPTRFEIINLEHDRDLRSQKLNLPLIPDGFFEIADKQVKQAFPFLLEADMDEEERPVWMEKIEKYLTNVFGSEAQRAFGFRHPRILCVTKPSHVKLLKKWTEDAVAKAEYAGHERLFYFCEFPTTSAEEFFLTPHFLIGGQDEPISLFDW